MELLRLKELIKDKGTTGKELAADVGVTPVTISNIVKGNNFPKPELLLKIAEVLDVDIRELFKSTKRGKLLNGFVEYEGNIYTVNTEQDLLDLISLLKEN